MLDAARRLHHLPPLVWLRRLLVVLLWLAAVAGLSAQTVHTEVFDNGLTVIHQRHRLSHAVEIRAVIRASPIYEAELLGSGASELLRRLALLQARQQLGPVPGELHSRLTVGASSFSIRTSDAELSDALAFLRRVLAVQVTAEAFAVAQAELVAQLQRGPSNDAARLQAGIRQVLFREHPARLAVGGTVSQVAGLRLQDLQAYAAQRYTAPNVILIIVGNLAQTEVLSLAKQHFDSLPVGGWQRPTIEDEPQQKTTRLLELYGGDGAREALVWRTMPLGRDAFTAPLEGSEQRQQSFVAVLEVVAALLEHPTLSPLRSALAGLASDLIVEHQLRPNYSGSFQIRYTPIADKGPEALRAVRDVLTRLAEQGPSADELVAAKRAVRMQRLLERSRVDGIADDLARWHLAIGQADFASIFDLHLADVQAPDVQRTVGSWLQPTYRNRSRVILSRGLAPPPVAEHGPRGAAIDPPAKLIEDLPGGARLYLRHLPQSGLVHVGASLGGGVAIEDEATAGATALLARALRAGSTRVQGAELSARLAELGMRLHSEATVHGLQLQITCFPQHLADAIRLLVDTLQRPALPEAVLASGAQEVHAALSLAADPASWQQRLIAKAAAEVFAGHYGSRDPRGSRASVSGLSRERLLAFHEQLLRGGNLVFTCFGELGDEAAVIAALREQLEAEGGLKSGPASVPEGRGWPEPVAATRQVSLAWDAPDTAVAVVWRGPDLAAIAGAGPALDVLELLLVGSQGDGGRLGERLRTLPGCRVTSVEAQRVVLASRGLWCVLCRYQGEAAAFEVAAQVRGAVDELVAALDPAAAGTLSDERLALARRQRLAQHHRQLEDQAGFARSLASAALTGGVEHLQVYATSLAEATGRAELRALAARYLQVPPSVVVALAAPRAPAPPAAPPAGEALGTRAGPESEGSP